MDSFLFAGKGKQMKNMVVCVSRNEWVYLKRFRARRRRMYRFQRMAVHFAKALGHYFLPDKGVLLVRLIAIPLCVITAILYVNCPYEAPGEGEIKFSLLLLIILLSSLIVLPKNHFNI